MKSSIKILGIIIFISVISLICVLNLSNKTSTNTLDLTYSNLLDDKTLNEVVLLLKDTEVPQDKIDIFKAQVKYTNEVIGDYPSLKEGFVTINSPGFEYDRIALFDLFAKAMVETDINCRIAAWPIMQDIVIVKNPWSLDKVRNITTDAGGILGYERCAVDVNEFAYMSEADLQSFWALYEDVPLEQFSSIEQSQKHIQQILSDRGISFMDSDRSLVTIFVYNQRDKLLEVRHVGVLVKRENDLLFVERLNPNSPYQVAIFKNRKELKYHLEHRFESYDIYDPIIMENGNPMVV